MSKPSSTLLALLRFAKGTPAYTWEATAVVLEPVFFAGMALADVLSVVLCAYEEALADTRFELGNAQYKARELLLAPIKGPCAVEWGGPRDLQTRYSVAEFYNSLLHQMLSELRLARVDWCDAYSLATA